MKDVRLLIATPTCRDMKPDYVQDLSILLMHLTKHGIKGHNLEKLNVSIIKDRSLIAFARQEILDHAIKNEFTHLLFIDDDQTFPYDMVDLFMSHDAEVIGANYCMKTASNMIFVAIGLDGKRINSKDKTGAVQASRIGGGIMLINVDAVKHIPKPHFAMPWDMTNNVAMPEDYFFCMRLIEYGITPYIDHDVSQKVGHVGHFNYNPAAFRIE